MLTWLAARWAVQRLGLALPLAAMWVVVLLLGPPPAAAQPTLRSADGQLELVADGAFLVLRNAAGQALKRWPLRDQNGQAVQVQALAHHSARRQFIVALAGSLELWLIGHDPAAPPLFNGWVHDWRMAEGIAEPGYLGLQRVRLQQALTALWADGRVPWVLGQAATEGAAQAVVLHLDIRREIAELALDGPLAQARLWPASAHGAWHLLLPAAPGSGGAWLVDSQRWQRQWLPQGQPDPQGAQGAQPPQRPQPGG